jgi:murein biosynthesis integral membrane protein MurJ
MALRIAAGVCASLVLILRHRPAVVVASGGYVSVPVVLAAWFLRRRIYVHEQNVQPGLANRLLALLATRVGASFAESLSRLPKGKAVHTGYPVRRQILEGSPERARHRFRIPADTKVAFIFGGSMGARSINRATVEALKTLLHQEHIAVIHATGLGASGEYRAFEDTRSRLASHGLQLEIPGRYVCQPFFSDIQDVYALADLVVARAGAGTVMELAAVGKPSLLIPKSDVPGEHQLLNAMALRDAGSAEVLFEERAQEGDHVITRVRGDALARKIADLLTREEDLAEMGRKARALARPDALSAHVSQVIALADPDAAPEVQREACEVGFLRDEQGTNHEVLFRATIAGTGLFADIKLPARAGRSRAIVLRGREDGRVCFDLLPRAGTVLHNGRPVKGRTRLAAGDVVTLGEERFVFRTETREVESAASGGTAGMRVLATSLGTLVSRIFGFLREAVAFAIFGLGNITDITAVGLSVANFFRGIFAEVAVDSAFLPTFVHLHRTGRRDAANRLFSAVVTWSLVLTGALTLVAILTLPLWMESLAPGFAGRGILPDAVLVTRIMFPYLVLVSLAAIISAVLRACNRFAAPAFSAIPFTLGVLAGTLGYRWYGLPALGAGVLLGGLGQVLWQLPTLLSRPVWRDCGLAFRPTFGLREPGVRKVARVAPNIVCDTVIQKASSVIDKTLATPLRAGAASTLYLGMVIFQLPFGLIAQSINTVILKELSESQALRDRDSTRRLLAQGINWTVFLLLPLTVAMILLAEPIVRLLFGYGRLDEAGVQRVASVLRWYAVGLVGWGLTGLFGRFFAARMEQMTGTLTSALGLVVNVAAAVSLVAAGSGEAGIAAATSLCFLVTAALRFVLLNRTLARESMAVRRSDVLPSLGQTTLATLGATIAAVVVYPAVREFRALPEVLNRLFVLAVPLGFGGFAFMATALLVRSEQVEEILLRLGRRPGGGEAAARPMPVNPYCMEPPARLLAWVQNRQNRGLRDQFNLARRAAAFLESRDWTVRNVGVKLIGEMKLISFRYDLCAIVRNREPASRLHRLFGGDFKEPGFVRRNAIAALLELEELDAEVERTLLDALRDPYYEVRAHAARALSFWADGLSGPGREEAAVRLAELARERNFEAAGEAVAALGRVAPDGRVVEVLRSLHYHRNWKVRERVVEAYGSLFERRIIADPKRILALLDDVLATSEGFTPRFPLRERMSELQGRLLRAGPAPGAGVPEARAASRPAPGSPQVAEAAT